MALTDEHFEGDLYELLDARQIVGRDELARQAACCVASGAYARDLEGRYTIEICGLKITVDATEFDFPSAEKPTQPADV